LNGAADVMEGVVVLILVGFETSGNDVKGVQEEIPSPVSQCGKDCNLTLLIKKNYLSWIPSFNFRYIKCLKFN
jgi:hypothetical protein